MPISSNSHVGQMRMLPRIVAKPWGRTDLDGRYGLRPEHRIGEIWFESPSNETLDVMVKYLFTSERLSIQVHPDEATAHARGLRHGKDECWIILDAEPGAEIGIGTIEPIATERLIAAAQDGSIEQLIDWRPAQRGQFLYSPARTVHALGPGMTVLEIQQATDATYRLYDYGRPRELHLDESRAVLEARPHYHPADSKIDGQATRILVDGPHFGAAWCAGQAPILPLNASAVQLVPIDADVSLGGDIARPGECWLVDDPALLRSTGAFVLAWANPA